MTCGYVCPVCEGNGYLEDGSPCDYCQKPKSDGHVKAVYFFTKRSILSLPWRSFLNSIARFRFEHNALKAGF